MKANRLYICFLLISSSLTAGWHDRKAEGWAWYEEFKEETASPDQIDNPPSTSTEQMEQIRKSIEEKLSQAILYPTEENVLAYMQEQKKWVDQSAAFASIWTQLLLSNPRLDETVTGRPVSQYGLQFHNAQKLEKREALIIDLARDQGLFFLYEGRDPVSSHVASIVQSFSQKYGWEVLAISVDGERVEEFPHSKNDNGISKEMGVDIFPALVIVDPKKNTATPIAYGLISIDKIEENIALQFKEHLIEGEPK